MSVKLIPVIAATARWLLCAYPAGDGALAAALAEAQVRQAVTVAAWLRYPTELDAALVNLVGPGGSGRLDWLAGAEEPGPGTSGAAPWRSWVDEVLASWAATLLADPAIATAAATRAATSEHAAGLNLGFRSLLAPDEDERRAAALLRQPDLLAPLADLHLSDLMHRLTAGPVDRR